MIEGKFGYDLYKQRSAFNFNLKLILKVYAFSKNLENEFHIIFEYHHLQFYALILRANVNVQEIGWNIWESHTFSCVHIYCLLCIIFSAGIQTSVHVFQRNCVRERKQVSRNHRVWKIGKMDSQPILKRCTAHCLYP